MPDPPPPGQPRRVGYLYLAAPLALYVLFAIVPIVQTGWISLHDWDGLGPMHWVGLGNYRSIASDPVARSAFAHSFVLVLFYSFLPIVLALAVTALVTRVRVRGLTLFRTVLFLPSIVSTVVVAATWRWIYQYDGPLNALLRDVGLGSHAKPWLGDYGSALPALGVVGTWTTFGLCTALFVAAVQRIPQSLYDAARVDGAGIVREFRAVTFAGIRGQFAVVLAFTIILGMRTFDAVYVLTGGGPGYSTTVPSLLLYNRAVTYSQVGNAAALATTLALLIFVVTLAVQRLAEGRER